MTGTQRRSNTWSILVSLAVAVTLSVPPASTYAQRVLRQPHSPASDARLVLRLVGGTGRAFQYQLETIEASLNGTVTGGNITFTMARPAKPGPIYTCPPPSGLCRMLWSWRTPGTVVVAAHWSGDAAHHGLDARLAINVRSSSYKYTGTVYNVHLGPMTHISSPPAVDRLRDARQVALLSRFATNDPRYACLKGKTLRVYSAPREFPDDDVVFTPRSGHSCATGAWLYAQQPLIHNTQLTITAPGATVTIPAALPVSAPASARVQLSGQGLAVMALPISAWSTQRLRSHIPPYVPRGTYAVVVSWYDRLTGSTVSSGSRITLRITRPLPTIVRRTTRVLDGTSIRDLEQSTRGHVLDNGRSLLVLPFHQATAQARGLRSGDIIVMGITSVTPQGLLRKIVSVKAHGADLSVVTTQAKLTDALQQGSIDIHGSLPVSTSGPYPHLKRLGADPQPTLCTRIDKRLKNLYRSSDNTINFYLELRTIACPSVNYHLSLTIANGQVWTVFAVSLKEKVQFQLLSTVATGRGLNLEQVFDVLHLPPFVVFFPDPIPFPVVIAPALQFKMGFKGTLSVGLKKDVVFTYAFTRGIACANASCEMCPRTSGVESPPIDALLPADCAFGKSVESNIDVTPPAQVTVIGQARLYAGPVFALYLYGLIGPYLQADVYLLPYVTPLDNPWFTLFWGLEVQVGIRGNVGNFDRSFRLLDYRAPLLFLRGSLSDYLRSLSNTSPTPIPVLTPPVAATASPEATTTPMPTATDTATPIDTPTSTPNPNCVEEVSINPTSGLPGTVVMVTWHDECGGTSVNGSVSVNGTPVATFVDPTDSGWSGSITIPVDTAPGNDTISVADDDGSSRSAVFVNLATPVSTPSDTPAATATPSDTPSPTSTP